MEIGKLIFNQKNKFILLVLLFILFACKDTKHHNISVSYDFICNGDIIYRYGEGFFSKYFRDFSEKEKIFSHTGIIYISNDTAYVIHSEASELTGIGGVKKDPLSSFLNGVTLWAIYRIDTTQHVRNQIADVALRYALIKTPFDLDFNCENDKRLYCSELVATSVNKAMKREIIEPKTNKNNINYYAIDDTYLVKEMKLIYKSKSLLSH